MQTSARSALRPLAFFSCALLFAGTAFADAAADRVLPLARQALQQAGSAAALIPLHRLYALEADLEELDPLENALLAVAQSRHANPDVAALARFYAAQVERTRGFPNRAAEQTARLGMLGHFEVIGGFDNEGKGGFDRAFPPESEQDFAKSYPGKQREVRWRGFEPASPDGYIDLSATIRPDKAAIAYAATDIDASSDTRVVFHVGASGASRLFVDGQKVLEDRQYHPAAFDQHAVAVTLRKGTHRLLLEVAQDDGAMGFYLRMAGPKGEMLPALRQRLPAGAVTPPKGSLQAQVIPPLVDALDRAAKSSSNAQAHADLAEALAFTRTYDAKDRRPAQESARAAKLAPKNADIQMLAARLEDDDANVRRQFLEAAAKAAPDRADAQLALARDDLNRGHPDRALERLRSFAAKHDSVELQLLWSRAQDELGDFAGAVQRVQAALKAHPRSAAALREAARQARRLERPRERAGYLRVVLSLRYDDMESRRALIQELVALGDVSGALEEQQRLLQLDPTDLSTLVRRGELLAANGKSAEARAVFQRAERLSPDDADLHEREGKALLALGDKPGALRALQASLSLRPQNPQLRESLRVLQNEEHGFGEQYAQDARALIARYPPMKGEDAEILSELIAVKVNPNGTSTRYVQQVARVQTDRGVDQLRSSSVSYSPDRQEVSVLRARIYRPDGSVLEAHSEGDQNLSEPWAGLYYDARSRVVSFPNLQPGDVVELAYRVDDAARDNLLSDYFGDLTLLQAEIPKHRLTYILDAPSSRPIYANLPKLAPSETEKTDRDGSTLYRWAWNEVPKIVSEPSMPGWGEASASLHVSTYKDWASVGRFYWGLVRDQLVATDEVKKTAQQIAAGIPPSDRLGRVRAVYDFVVSKTRYVGLEFGIHGYKPYPVDRILSRHFGDCKDKASLMHTLLAELGVPSDLVLLRMKRLGDVAPEPASLAIFNHAILYVPEFDMYLDGTAEYYGSSELPNQDTGAMVLVIKPEGGSQIGQIPEGKAAQNRTESTFDVALERDGSAHLAAQSEVRGLSAPEYRRAYATPATRRAVFEQAWSRTFPGLTVEKVDLGDPTQLEKPVKLAFSLSVPHFGDVSPAGVSFAPFSKARSYVESYAPLSERKFDLVLPFPWQNHFVYRYHLPHGTAPGPLPAEFSKSTPFGSAKLGCKRDGETLLCEGDIEIDASRVRTADYAAFRAFLGELDQALARQVLLAPTLPAPAVEGRAQNP